MSADSAAANGPSPGDHVPILEQQNEAESQSQQPNHNENEWSSPSPLRVTSAAVKGKETRRESRARHPRLGQLKNQPSQSSTESGYRSDHDAGPRASTPDLDTRKSSPSPDLQQGSENGDGEKEGAYDATIDPDAVASPEPSDFDDPKPKLPADSHDYIPSEETRTGLSIVVTGRGEVQPVSLLVKDNCTQISDKDNLDVIDLITKQQSEIETMKVEVTREKEEKECLHKELEHMKKEKAAMQLELQHAKRNCELEMWSLNGKLTHVTEECNSCKQQLSVKELEIERIKTDHFQALEKAKTEAEARISRISKENEAMVNKLKAREVASELEQYKLRAQLAEIEKRCEIKISDLQLKLRDKEIELRDKEIEFLKKAKEVAEKEAKIRDLQAQIEVEKIQKAKDEEMRSKDEEMQKTQEDLAFLKKRIAELEHAQIQKGTTG